MITIQGAGSHARVWYDRKRGCYASNVAILLSRETGVPAPLIAAALARWINENYAQQYEAWAS